MTLTVQQRFAVDAQKHGGNPHPKVGYKFPTHREMDELQRQNLPFDVDEKLRKPLVEINKAGYRTTGSCSGHTCDRGGSATPQGWIQIAPHKKDPFLENLKAKHPDIHACIKPQLDSKCVGYSKVQVDPTHIRSIIKRYTDAERVDHKKPIIDRPIHAFSFKALSDNPW